MFQCYGLDIDICLKELTDFSEWMSIQGTVTTRQTHRDTHRDTNRYKQWNVNAASPEDDAVQVKGIFNDASGWHSHSQDVLQVGQVIRWRDSVDAVQVTKQTNTKSTNILEAH